MKKFLLIYAMGATLLAIACGVILHRTHREVARLRNNNEALTTETTLYRTRLDESAASVVALQHKLKEYREQHAHDTKRIKALGVRLRRVESIATAASQTKIETVTPLHDTLFLDRLLPDTASIFRWSDNWVRIEGTIRNGKAECRIESIDTLRQVIHRVPRKFLFFRYGTKAIRQEIISSNPHTRIVYAEYIELPKRQRKR
ncbi:MAG: hypothetical protein E7140_02965 [Rikenellaceae bacterium]|nr:hypothetical protein [Rikenellaceae bacterium]